MTTKKNKLLRGEDSKGPGGLFFLIPSTVLGKALEWLEQSDFLVKQVFKSQAGRNIVEPWDKTALNL